MVWYYCEFCNKNIQVSEGRITCKGCGHLLYNRTITKEEKQRRDRERTTYCEYCDKMEYAVPIQIAISNTEQQGQLALQKIKHPPRTALRVKDGRYKLGYRLTEEGKKKELIYCVLCILTIFTLGLALIPIYLYYHLKNKREREGINLMVDSAIGDLDYLSDFLNQTSVNYDYICRMCIKGVKLGESPNLNVKKAHLHFDERCLFIKEPRIISDQKEDYTKFIKRHILLTIYGMCFLITMIIGVSAGQGTPIYDLTITIASTLIILFIPILIVDICISIKIKTQKSKRFTQKKEEILI